MKKIKLSSIIPAPWNARMAITPTSVADLERSIAEQGLINPITLWRDQQGQFICIAGNRRLKAIKLHYAPNEATTDLSEGVEYTIFDGTEHEARMVTIAENLQREDIGIIEEANAVNALLDLGASVETVAARIGRSSAWVRRRAKLSSLDDGWKARAADMDADALEHIAAFPTDIQQRVAKVAAKCYTKWNDLDYLFNRESRDIDSASFDRWYCTKCLKRTGVEADLFGVADGQLGRCLDAKCFDKRMKLWEKETVANIVGDAESVVCKYAWELPSDSVSSPRKTADHPCAYVFIGDEQGPRVKWAESPAMKKAREDAARAERDAKNAEQRKRAEREDAVTNKLDAWTKSNDDTGEYPDGMEDMIRDCLKCDGATSEWIANVLAEKICGWNDGGDWSAILRAFPRVCELAGVTDDDREFLFGEYPQEDNKDNN